MKRIELENKDIDLVWNMDMSYRHDGLVMNQRYMKIIMFKDPEITTEDIPLLRYITSSHIRRL